MENDSVTDPSGGLDARKILEIEKLREEVDALRRPWWRNPRALGGCLIFLVSLAFNVVQAVSNSAELARKEKEYRLSESRWLAESKEQEQNLDRLTKDAEYKNSRRQSIEAQLEKVKEDISVWSNAIFQDKMRLISLRAEVDLYRDRPNSEFKLKAAIENVDLQSDMIKDKENLLSQSRKRESELELQLQALTCS